jgi:hypothetical protein
LTTSSNDDFALSSATRLDLDLSNGHLDPTRRCARVSALDPVGADHLDAALSLGAPIEVALHQIAQQRGPSFASSFDTSPCSSLASGRERYPFAR